MVPRARNGRYGGLGTRTARVPGRWVRWIGWIRVRDAERDVCGVEHLRYAQGYGPTATENGTAGRGDIHTNAINKNHQNAKKTFDAIRRIVPQTG